MVMNPMEGSMLVATIDLKSKGSFVPIKKRVHLDQSLGPETQVMLATPPMTRLEGAFRISAETRAGATQRGMILFSKWSKRGNWIYLGDLRGDAHGGDWRSRKFT